MNTDKNLVKIYNIRKCEKMLTTYKLWEFYSHTYTVAQESKPLF